MSVRPDFKNCDQCEMPRSCQGVRHCAKKNHPHRPRDPNSLRGRITALVEQHGPCTVNDLEPLLPEVARETISRTLVDCAKEGRIVRTVFGTQQGYGRGRSPSTFDSLSRGMPAMKPMPDERAPSPLARVASVFDLARHL